jgi:predicted regulator of Ras-like GTPase activity (Roadblock/LC7/MglB family)
MFGVFKKFFSRSSRPPPAAAPVTGGSVRTPVPAAPPRPSTPAAPSPAPTRSVTQAGDKIGLPLNEILSQLPDDLGALVLLSPGGMFSVSASDALKQLRTGAVRIPFSQLRQGAPPGTFANDASRDDSLIDLPLALILAAIGPAGLARRSGQKRIEVPDEVKGVFGTKDRRVTISAAAASGPAAAPAAPMPAAAARVTSPPSAPKPVAPSAAAPRPTTSIAKGPAAPNVPAPAPLPFAAPKPAFPLPFAATRPAPAPPAAAVPAAAVPAASGERVVMTIASVSGGWPASIHHEIRQFNLGSESISIPVSRLEPGMKAGRIVFTWAELCGWLGGPLLETANGQSQVELPLEVVAPLFLAKHRAATPRKIVTVGAEVPDLFGGLARPAPPAPEPPAAPAPEPVPAPAAAPVFFPAEPPVPVGVPEIRLETLEQPAEPELTPEEVVQWILTLPGVAGALLASNDGLLVAGQLPAPLEAETMAAFLPQILMRVGICTEEIRLGRLRSVTLLVGQTPCAMFKAGALCLAVLGQPGQTLPEGALERMAGELAQQNQ